MVRPLLDVAGLTVTAREKVLVQDFALTLARGERVGLIGESGSGKSLTAAALMGLLPEGVSATGSVRLDGVDHDLIGASDRQLSRLRGNRLGMVFQEPLTALNPLMKVGRQVAEVLTRHRTVPGRAAAAQRSVDLLASVQLPDPAEAARAYPHQLSGGQRQRVLLAMALANDPDLLICDEPTTALDVSVQRQMLELISDGVARRGSGLLFITHDLAVAASICDRILVMRSGTLVEQGATDEVFSRPQHPYTRGLLAASDLTATDGNGRLFTVATAAGYTPASARATPPAPSANQAPSADQAPAADQLPAAEPARAAEPAPAAVARIPTPDEAPASPLIRVRDLTRIYRRQRSSLFRPPAEVHALRDVSFDVAAGQRFGVVGESGSGKSTLLRILAGLDLPSSGSVTVAGNEVAGSREGQLRDLRRELQIVFQDPMGSLNPRMRVGDIIAEPLLLPGVPVPARHHAGAVAQMLAAVGLPQEAADRFPHQFSGGQRQRIAIARALICEPRILVADEPVSALDVSVRAQVLNLLSDLVDKYQLTLVFVSHDLGVVRHLCDTVAVMHRGRIVETGPTEQIYAAPAHQYTKTLVASSLSLHDGERMRAAATP
ncbi:ABC transporter ATP-binding protein [Arthrobacter sp. zg-Y1219]|uniref:ABC transporter ATP-binding protein n=1 Tax=Arthrobacter sp. zg-Y1219 TaxID=3049067 RepID=UPI0024C2EF32|nr:ABC transporter ATP-binding protein [Arthrobacter sp. zg-Y1219]MDK1361204.1 ABC transporter ATP-binding protein [Arthrobacter sp. zg-Y1219]